MQRMKQNSVTIVFLSFLIIVTALLFVLPKAERSENEKRTLAAFPELTADSVFSGNFGKEFETYLADHFPMRDVFYGIHSYTQLYTGRNGQSGIYACDDGYLLATPGELDTDIAKANVQIFAQFAQSTDLPTTVIAVPNPGYILDEKLPNNHLDYMDDAAFQIITDNAGDMQVIDLRDTFQNTDEQIYFKTDHHLTAAGSYEMYVAFCQATGRTPTAFSCATTSDGFYGTGYSKSGLWLKEPDTLEIWKPQTPSAYRVTISDHGTEETYDSLYFEEHLDNLDQYPVYLDGNHALTIIENQNVQNGKRLLIIKDSYAHTFATYAAEDYEMICMVDLRYYQQMTSSLIEQYGLNEILVLYGVENLVSSTDIARLW